MAGLPYCTESKARAIAAEVAASSSGGTQVIANPTLAGTEETLTGLQVGDTKYKVANGGGGETKEIVFKFSAGGDMWLIRGSDGSYNPGFVVFNEDGSVLSEDEIDALTATFVAGEIWTVTPNNVGTNEVTTAVGVACVCGNNYRIGNGMLAQINSSWTLTRGYHFGKTGITNNPGDPSATIPGLVLTIEKTDGTRLDGVQVQSANSGAQYITIKKIA